MRLAFAYPGDLDTRTGAYGYDRRLIEELRTRGWQVDLIPLGDGFPFPTSDVLATAEARLSALPDGHVVLVDGSAFGVMDAWARREASRLRLFALVHHPLALEGGMARDLALRLMESERTALAEVRGTIVTSSTTARELHERFGVAERDIRVALPGTDIGPVSLCEGNPPHIVAIGSLIRRKGHDVLVDALSRIAELPWHATIVGTALDPDVASALHAQIDSLGLADRIVMTGGVQDTRAVLASADIFALASRYEGYGMVFAEALAQGLPIVACHAGAIPDVVPDEAGILVPPDDAVSFAAALSLLIADRPRRRSYAEGARAAGARLPAWTDTGARVATFLEQRA